MYSKIYTHEEGARLQFYVHPARARVYVWLYRTGHRLVSANIIDTSSSVWMYFPNILTSSGLFHKRLKPFVNIIHKYRTRKLFSYFSGYYVSFLWNHLILWISFHSAIRFFCFNETSVQNTEHVTLFVSHYIRTTTFSVVSNPIYSILLFYSQNYFSYHWAPNPFSNTVLLTKQSFDVTGFLLFPFLNNKVCSNYCYLPGC